MTNRPIFEHRHFAWLAAYARGYMSEAQASILADKLADTNPKFDRDRFMAAATASPINWRDEARNNIVPLTTNRD